MALDRSRTRADFRELRRRRRNVALDVPAGVRGDEGAVRARRCGRVAQSAALGCGGPRSRPRGAADLAGGARASVDRGRAPRDVESAARDGGERLHDAGAPAGESPVAVAVPARRPVVVGARARSWADSRSGCTIPSLTRCSWRRSSCGCCASGDGRAWRPGRSRTGSASACWLAFLLQRAIQRGGKDRDGAHAVRVAGRARRSCCTS